MSTQPPSRRTVGWLDPSASDPDRGEEFARIRALGLEPIVLRDGGALHQDWSQIQLLVIRLDHDTQLLEDCLPLLELPGRRVPLVCRVPRHQFALAVSAMRLGADHVLSTDEWDPAAWAPVLEALEPQAAAAPARRPRSVVFVDPVSQQLLLLAQRVAQTEVSALLTGPTGAGKEVLARVLHEASPRSGGPFVSLNCGALPEHLIEDLLFGHEKGAFSGAIREHQGVFEQAQGGTVFLDEIGEMPMHLQTRLLRVLQERCITRLGGARTIPVNVRIVAATNKDLKAAMLQREFREDLYFRISTFTLRVPPLRERPQDILPLAAHFLRQHGAGRGEVRLGEAAQQRLLAYLWPGNVRELENVMQRALVLCSGTTVWVEHLMFDEGLFIDAQPLQPLQPMQPMQPVQPAAPVPMHPLPASVMPPALPIMPTMPSMPAPLVPSEARLAAEASATAVSPTDAPPLQWAVRHSELQVIQDAIRRTASREAAARMLGISPRTLRYKLAQMRNLGMTSPEVLQAL